MMKPFWLDANVLIEAQNRWYPFELVPKFWGLLSEEIESGSICCPKAVFDEIVPRKDQLDNRVKDQLSVWVKTRKDDGLCVPPTDAIQAQFKLIADHVVANFSRHHYEEFLTVADPWLIATAKVIGGTVVTGESESRKKKIRIPSICRAFAIPCIDLPTMVRHFNRVLS
jgi:hypothetical protein